MKIAEYRKLVKPRESDIQNECIAYLEKQGYYVQRLNAGGYKMGNAFVHGVKAGTPDIMAFKKYLSTDGVHKVQVPFIDLVFVEVKRPGGIVSKLQEVKMDELTQYGARCFVVYSVEELKGFI
jgi:hypothetical protein